jgi:hypothetical protein
MQEALLHYIWQHSLFENEEYIADTGEKINILATGTHNRDGGPDFTNAKIVIDGMKWAGNVEIHGKSSEWKNHGHHRNAAYDNVILHVVENVNTICTGRSGRRIPCIKLKFDQRIKDKYHELLNREELIRCSDFLNKIDPSLITFWLSALAVERLCSKTRQVQNIFKTTQGSWEETFYIHVAQSFGLKINSLPFELLAKATPLKVLAKHRKTQFQLESLLFGQAGFLENGTVDEYKSKLKEEYQFLKKKYKLKNIEPHLWKFLRLRPSNFPTIRIAEFCSIIYDSKGLFSMVLECTNAQQIRELINCNVSDYWKKHYTFGKVSQYKNKSLGQSSVNAIIINTIIPFMFIYGDYKNKEEMKDRAIRLLEQLPPENNKITKKWTIYNIKARHAAESQALLQLTNIYCRYKKCLECQIGNLVLRRTEQ